MKTYILSILLIFGLAAQNHGKPITEIYSLKDPVIAEEAYVNDIPFNTWEIAVEAILDGDEARLEEESYVDDIPFDTRKIALEFLLQKIEDESEETSINDIPFDTEKIMYDELTARMTEKYRKDENSGGLAEAEMETRVCLRK
jgi:hypothetical protein